MKNLMVNNLISKMPLSVQQKLPGILLVGGLISGGAAIVTACTKSIKAKEIIDSYKKDKQDIEFVKNNVEEKEYSENDYKEDKKNLAIQTAFNLLKTYSPTIILSAISITLILSGYGVLNKRYASTAAALGITEKIFNKYRKNVKEKYGEEVDKEMRYGVKEKVEEIIDSKGKTKKVKTKIVSPKLDEYTRIFDKNHHDFTMDNEANKKQLLRIQAYCNEILKIKGYMFLNDVLEQLCMKKTPYGQTVGWIWDKHDPSKQTEIDFGIFDLVNIDVTNDNEISPIYLSFNIYGDILNEKAFTNNCSPDDESLVYEAYGYINK